ncbi:uncharacterized protein [Halyomorpha halys]|uniref:uncharacterized protein n=1 Tax=Halyomorpha halys TaxID=286706 RepID=UPI0006D50927|nr:uncharacterized protein LOC106683421 [Halyomorpha halys]
MNAFEWNHEKLTKLIDLYRERPELWDPTNNDYHVKNKKNDGWNHITKEMGCELAELKVKMTSLLSSYRREKMKTKKSIAIAERPEEIYQSRWFAYKSFDFLKDRVPIYSNHSIADEKASQDVSDENNETAVTPHSSHGSTTCTPQNEDEPPKKLFCSSKRRPSKKNHPRLSQDGIIDPIENECTKFGELIAVKLQKFGDEERSILMHRINNFVYEAETEMYAQHHYNYNSASSTPSPLANQYSQAQYQPSAPQAPVPFSLLKPEQTELSPSNCNSSQ